jgi:anti-anti-sigma factor
MAFTVRSETSDNGIATIFVAGELDAGSAPAFRSEIDAVAQNNPKRLVLEMSGLTYMASAGLRVLIFARQKMAADTEIYCVGVAPNILETLEMTGMVHSVHIVDSLEAASEGM